MIQPSQRQMLAGRLAHFRLTQDDSGPFRVYRDEDGRVYDSVTHVLAKTGKPVNFNAPGWFGETMKMSAERGTLMHSSAEYLLKTAKKLASNAANKRGMWKETRGGLWRCPSALTQWALKEAHKGMPTTGIAARGFSERLNKWILGHVTAIYLVEFRSCVWVE